MTYSYLVSVVEIQLEGNYNIFIFATFGYVLNKEGILKPLLLTSNVHCTYCICNTRRGVGVKMNIFGKDKLMIYIFGWYKTY